MYVWLRRADDGMCFHISDPSIAQLLAKLSSQSGRLKPLHRRWSKTMIKFVAELTEFIPLQWYEFGQPGNKLNHSLRNFYVCLQRADDELCFHVSGPSIAQVLAKLSSQSGRLKPLHRR